MCPLIEPNFDEVAEVANGEYSARIVDAESKTSHAGNPMVNWKLEIYGETAGKAQGQHVRLTTMVTGKGAFKLKQLYIAATGQECTGAFDTDVLMGKAVKIVVDDEKRDGQLTGYKEVKSVKAIA